MPKRPSPIRAELYRDRKNAERIRCDSRKQARASKRIGVVK